MLVTTVDVLRGSSARQAAFRQAKILLLLTRVCIVSLWHVVKGPEYGACVAVRVDASWACNTAQPPQLLLLSIDAPSNVPQTIQALLASIWQLADQGSKLELHFVLHHLLALLAEC